MNRNQLTVSFKDIEKSITFYETLGLLLIVKPPHYARLIKIKIGDTFRLVINHNVRHIKHPENILKMQNI